MPELYSTARTEPNPSWLAAVVPEREQEKRLESVRDRHLDWIASLARNRGPGAQLGDPEATAAIDRELANVRAALVWAETSSTRSVTGLRVINDLGRYWFNRTLMAEASGSIERLLRIADSLEPRDRARALCNLGFFLLESDKESDPLSPLEESLRIAEELDDRALLAQVLHYVVRAGFDVIDPARLLAMIEHGRRLAHDLNDPVGIYVHETTSVLWHLNYDPTDLSSRAEMYRDMFSTATSAHVRAHVPEIAALALIADGDVGGARPLLREAFEHYRDLENVGCASHALEALAWLLARSGDMESAEELLHATQHLRRTHHAGREPFEAYAFNQLGRELDGVDVMSVRTPAFATHGDAIDQALRMLDAH